MALSVTAEYKVISKDGICFANCDVYILSFNFYDIIQKLVIFMEKSILSGQEDIDSFERTGVLYACRSHSIIQAKRKETNENFLLFEYNFLRQTKSSINSFVEKVELLMTLSHPSLMQIKGYILPEEGKNEKCYTICKPTAKGCLVASIDRIKIFQNNKSTYSPAQIVTMIYGIASGMLYLHSCGIVHGELQPCDIFLNKNYEPLIANYGIVQINPARKNQVTDVSTQMFLAPEMYTSNIKKMTYQSDIYAFAVLCFRILSKRNIFQKEANEFSFAENIINGHRLKMPSYIYPFLRDMIGLCWSQVPADRPPFSVTTPKLRSDIECYTPNLDKEAFRAYCEKMEINDWSTESVASITTGQSVSIDTDVPSSPLIYGVLPETLTPPPSPSSRLQMTRSESSFFQISLLDIDAAKLTKEFKELSQVKLLNPSEREHTIKIIILQDTLMELDPQRFDQSVDWIIKNINFDDTNDVISVVSNLIIAAKVRFKKIKIYANLMKNLNDANSELCKTGRIKEFYISRLFDLMLHNEPSPNLTSNIALLKLACNAGVYTNEEIIGEIRKFFYEMTRTKRLICLVFAWFAEEIFESDKKLYDDIIDVFKQHSEDLFFPKEYRSFYEDLPKLMQNDWEVFKRKTSLITNDSILDAILNDDISSLIEVFERQAFKFTARVICDAYELCSLIYQRPTVSMFAAVYGASKVFQFLQMKVSSITKSKDSVGRTPPVFAAAGGSLSVMRITDQQVKDIDGALQAAIRFHQNEGYHFLLKSKKCDPKLPDRSGSLPMVAAAASNNLYVMMDLIKRGVSPFDCESFGTTPLHAAAEAGNCDAIKFLLSIDGIDVNVGDVWNVTALHIAADKCQSETMKLLLHSRNIDVNARTEALKTPLHVAVETEFPNVVELLLGVSDVDINCQDKKGATPLHTACKLRNHGIIKLFLQRKDVDLTIKDKKGRTPYMIAVEMEDDEAITMFEERALHEDDSSCRI